VRYEWVPKNEPLVWLADADAGAVLASERGEADWLRRLSEATSTVVVRPPMTRMSLGSHDHLAVSLAPPRLYFTGLKTLRAPTSMPTPLFVRKRGPLTAQNPVPLPFR